jgi:hypothetical protein
MANARIRFKETKNTTKGLEKHKINRGEAVFAFSGDVP